jgi:hypothetical protein
MPTPNTGTKHHREPREVRKLWLLTRLPEQQAPRSGPKGQTKTNDDEKRDNPDVPSRKIAQDNAVPVSENRTRLCWPNDTPDDKRADDDFTHHRYVDTETTVESGISGLDVQLR